jgi:glutathione peroxidase
MMEPTSVFDFTVTGLDGSPVTLDRYRGRVLLVVNVASKCGFTPQYSGLQSLYEKYRDGGFEVLGFPCNQFLWQEPGDADQINACPLKYNVTFPVFGKVKVNGPSTCDLYRFLKRKCRGTLWTQAIKWNFAKFLVNRDGVPVRRISTLTTPAAIEPMIQALLQAPVVVSR